MKIHAGYTKDTIKNQINKLVQYNNTDSNLWIFFDEFNTTQELGLIKEIFVERTMEGYRIPDNFVIVAACNAWRKINKQQERIGL